MTRRQRRQLTRWLRRSGSPPTTERIGRSRTNVAKAASISRLVLALNDLDLQPDGARRRLHVSQRGLGSRGIGRIDEHGDTSGPGTSSCSNSSRFALKLDCQMIEPGDIAARPSEAGDKTKPDRVVGDHEDDGNCRGRRLGCERRMQCRSRRSQRLVGATRSAASAGSRSILTLGPAIFDRHVRALDVAQLAAGPGGMRADASAIVSASWRQETRSRGIAGCCARAASGHAAAAPPSSVMNSRRS